MAEMPEPVWYCLACGTDNPVAALICRRCAVSLAVNAQQERQGAAFLLNELQHLHATGEITDDVYLRLSERYREALRERVASKAPAPSAERPAPPEREGPGWLAEQQANLLLYLGAFLIVIAALVFVSTSGEAISDAARMVLLVLGTLLFLAAGLFCLRFPRVQQAGVVFFAVGSLMVPITFVGAFGLFYADDDGNATGLWLAGSLTSALLYGAVSLLRIARWYPVPMVFAILSGLGAALVLADAPAAVYPGSYVAVALALSGLAIVPVPRVRETFSPIVLWAAHLIVPAATLAALAMTAAVDNDGDFEIGTRWYLPATAAIVALFYWTQALWARRDFPRGEVLLPVLALAVTGGAAVTVVFALNVGEQWYGPAVAIVGWLYVAAGERFGPRWLGQRYADLLAIGAITASWLLFAGLYADFPREGTGVYFSAAAFYLAAARLHPALRFDVLAGNQRGDQQPLRLPASAVLIYAAGLMIALGFFYLLSSLPAAETAEASDLSIAFFGLSLGVAAIAATMRLWWPELRLHAYAVAVAMSVFVLISSAEAEGQVTALLAAYTGVALALTFWERTPPAFALPAIYGFFALLAAWRYYEPTDLYLPLVVSFVGYAFFAGYAMLRQRDEDWSQEALAVAFAYAAAAPIVGWVRLAILADADGLVGTTSFEFEETSLYQTSAAAVLLLALLVVAQAWLVRNIALAAGASALLMVALLLEIGHFQPENVQAYTAPIGVYLIAGASLGLRFRGLPDDMQVALEPMQAVGAVVLMGPSLVQSWEDGGGPHALLLLGEGLLLLAVALVQRWLWLLSPAVGFIVLVALRYLFSAAQVLPNWAILAIAGALVMAAGTAILLGRERWTVWQRTAQAWWRREPLPSS